MGEVIYVDFGSNKETIFNCEDELNEYLTMLQTSGICEDDILDIREAISSYSVYLVSDPEIQQFADAWNEHRLSV